MPSDQPLDLSPFAVIPEIDPTLRQTLLTVGVQLGVLMMSGRMTPEEVAEKTGLTKKQVYHLMVGLDPDIGFGKLNELAKVFGASLSVQLTKPQPTPSS